MNSALPRHLFAALLAAGLATPAFAQYSTPMRDVENPERSAVMLSGSASFESPFVNAFLTFTFPAAKRYFIDQVSMYCVVDAAGDVVSQVILQPSITAGGFTTGYTVPLSVARTGPGTFGSGSVYAGTTLLKVFHDATSAQPLYVNLFHTMSSQTGNCYGTLVGHTLP